MKKNSVADAFHRLHHQVGHRPDIDAAHPAGKVAVVDGEHDQQADDRPEGNLARHGADAQAGERQDIAAAWCAAPNIWRTCGRRTATRSGSERGSSSSCWRALAARLPCERAVSASTDMGNSAQTPSQREPRRRRSRAGGCREIRPANIRKNPTAAAGCFSR